MGPPHRMPRGNHQLLRKRHHLLRNSHHMMGYSSASAELPTLLSTFKSKLSSWFASGLSESLQLKVCTCLLCTLCLAATTSACSASWNASFSLLTTVATAGCGSSLPSSISDSPCGDAISARPASLHMFFWSNGQRSDGASSKSHFRPYDLH